MATCRSCDAPVVWMQTTAGKAIPIDGEDSGGWVSPATFDDGNVRRTEGRAKTKFGSVSVVEVVKPGEGLWRSHFSSCRDAPEWRKPKEKS